MAAVSRKVNITLNKKQRRDPEDAFTRRELIDNELKQIESRLLGYEHHILWEFDSPGLLENVFRQVTTEERCRRSKLVALTDLIC